MAPGRSGAIHDGPVVRWSPPGRLVSRQTRTVSRAAIVAHDGLIPWLPTQPARRLRTAAVAACCVIDRSSMMAGLRQLGDRCLTVADALTECLDQIRGGR